MAYQDTHNSNIGDLPQSAFSGIGRVFAAIGTALVSVSAANRRLHLVERLSAKSDAELAELGLRREDIVRKVFIDMLDV